MTHSNQRACPLASAPTAGAQAVYTTSALAPGSHSLTATYSGDGSYLASTSATLYQSVAVLQAGADIFGVVTDRGTNQPIAGVKVYVNCGQNSCFQTTTDGNGVCSLTGAQLGNSTSAFLYFEGTGYYVNTGREGTMGWTHENGEK